MEVYGRATQVLGEGPAVSELEDLEPLRTYCERHNMPSGSSAYRRFTGTVNGERYMTKEMESDSWEAASYLVAQTVLPYFDVNAPEVSYDLGSDEVVVRAVGDPAPPLSTYAHFTEYPADIDTDSFYTAVATHRTLGNSDIIGNFLLGVNSSEPLPVYPNDFDLAGRETIDRSNMLFYEEAGNIAEAVGIAFDPAAVDAAAADVTAPVAEDAIRQDLADVKSHFDGEIPQKIDEYAENVFESISRIN